MTYVETKTSRKAFAFSPVASAVITFMCTGTRKQDCTMKTCQEQTANQKSNSRNSETMRIIPLR